MWHDTFQLRKYGEVKMPLIPTVPNSKDIDGPKIEKDLSKMHIHEFRIITDPNAADGAKVIVEVKWSEGYETGDPAVYVPVNIFVEMFSGTEIEAAVAENTGGESLYTECKNALWAWLQTTGHAPAGNIT